MENILLLAGNHREMYTQIVSRLVTKQRAVEIPKVSPVTYGKKFALLWHVNIILSMLIYQLTNDLLLISELGTRNERDTRRSMFLPVLNRMYAADIKQTIYI